MSEQKEIINAIIEETALVSGMTSAFYIENEKWPTSVNELEKFISLRVIDEKYDQELIRKCRIFLWRYKDFRFNPVSRNKLSAYYKYKDKVDVSISISMEKASVDEKHDYVLNLHFETYQVEGSIDEFRIAHNSDKLDKKDDIINQLIGGIIFGLIEVYLQNEL